MHGDETVRTGLVARVERAIGAFVGAVAAALVVAEIVVLFAGVCARYLFRSPLIWSDEVAGILFLWLAMLGAALALHRGEHMRMTAVAARLGSGARTFLDRFALCAAAVFLAAIIKPSFDFALDDMDVSTPALEISSGWRSMALPVGFSLMLALVALQLAAAPERRFPR